MLPFLSWRHDRFDTRLNEVRKLGISLEAENLLLRELPILKRINRVCIFVEF